MKTPTERLLVVVGLIVCGTTVAIFAAVQTASAAVTSQTVSGTATPSMQPGTAFADANLRFDIDLAYDATKSPGLTQAIIHFDSDFSFDATGIAECDPALIAGTTTVQARAACPGSRLGSGRASFDGSSGPVPAVVTAFYGEHATGDPPVVLLHVRVDTASLTGVSTGVISPSTLGGDFGSQLDLTVPLPPDVVLTHLDVTLGEKMSPGDEFVSARCNDSNKTWDFAGRYTFAGNPTPVAVSDTQQCHGPQPAVAFGPPRTVATAASGVGTVHEIETGDLNDDGNMDVVVGRVTWPATLGAKYPIGIFLGDGQGGFTNGDSLWQGPIPRAEHVRQIVIADFNADGREDIFVADHGAEYPPGDFGQWQGHPNILALSTPDGKLTDASANMPPESAYSHSAAAADVDGDDDLDIFVGNFGLGDGTPPEILVNDGTGHFVRGVGMLEPIQDCYGGRVLFVDLNNDDALDMFIGTHGLNPNSVHLNDGTGHFDCLAAAMPPKPFDANALAYALGTLDANDDGDPDLVVAWTQGTPPLTFSGRRLQLLLGNGDGTFSDETPSRLAQQSASAKIPGWIRVADVDGDGDQDFGASVLSPPVFTSPPSPEAADVYLDNGAGAFSLNPGGAGVVGYLFLDANKDGRLDIFTSYGGSASVTERHEVLLQATETDLDGDGRDNPQDNCPTAGNYDQANLDGDALGDACDSDRDGDGVPDATDECRETAGPGANGCTGRRAAALKKCKKKRRKARAKCKKKAKKLPV